MVFCTHQACLFRLSFVIYICRLRFRKSSLELDWFVNSCTISELYLGKGNDVMLWRNAGTKSIKEPCDRVTYTIIPLNVPDFYKYRTGVIVFKANGNKKRATVTMATAYVDTMRFTQETCQLTFRE